VSSQSISKVYRLYYCDGFEGLQPVDKEDYERLWFDGTSRIASWKPVKMKRLIYWEDGSRLVPGDFPACAGGDLVVSGAAKSLLRPALEEAGELLPLDLPDGNFWTLNVTRLVDALDEEKSDILRASDTGQILRIRRHSFRADRLGPEIFKLSQSEGRGLIYVTETFVQRVRATPLKGLDFKLVWAAN
jgi:hypothetical protein